ncbi:Panacea domain-containing protein [Methylomonas sp. HYX-M1]|uniref:Panacea domain-containing protein n=1 Tax=Methylomonas sp. HYX-M1 TaxID=3139307 RepID=UPI00345B9259
MTISNELEIVEQTIIYLHREMFDESPSPMKLQKLCYYAQGYALAQGDELFPEEFQAWQHGPVVKPLYWKYQHYKWRQISNEVPDPQTEHLEYLREIVAAYGRYDGAALSTMTHRETPWLEARGELPESAGSSAIIGKESMKSFFSGKLNS